MVVGAIITVILAVIGLPLPLAVGVGVAYAIIAFVVTPRSAYEGGLLGVPRFARKNLPKQDPSAEGGWSSPGYRSGRTRAKWAEALFALTALAGTWAVVAALSGVILANRALGGDIPTSSELASYFNTYDAVGDLCSLCAVALAVAFLAWLSRTVEIVPVLGAGTPKDSPRWAIGWWFIPIAFLWKPYTVVREVWDRLALPARATGGALVLAWWLAWIAAFLVQRTGTAMSDAVSSWGSLQFWFWVSFARLGALRRGRRPRLPPRPGHPGPRGCASGGTGS